MRSTNFERERERTFDYLFLYVKAIFAPNICAFPTSITVSLFGVNMCKGKKSGGFGNFLPLRP